MRKIGQLSISALIIYYMWFNELYGHNALIVYGSFIIMVICFLVEILMNGDLNDRDFHFGIWINLFVVFYSIIPGMFVAYDQSSLLEYARLVFQYSIIILILYYYAMHSENGINWVLITLNIGGLLCSYFLITNPVQVIQGRFSLSYHDNPNALGFILTLGMFSVMYRFKPSINWMLINVPQISAMLYGVIMTGSRKCLIGALIITVIWTFEVFRSFHNNISNGYYYLLILVVIAILAVMGRYLWFFYQQSRLSDRMETFLDDESNGNRLRFYHLAWEIFKDKPFFGGGLEQFGYWAGTGGYAHSTYADVLANFGLIGAIVYFSPIISAGKQAFHNAIEHKDDFKKRMILALWLLEMFMGIGQVFYLDIMHYLAWAIIYYNVQELAPTQEKQKSRYFR